jgi:ABC-2 type transport system ATP-binding protein
MLRDRTVRRAIGVALQDAAIDPLMTGHELVRLQAVLHGIAKSEARRRGGELLERVGLTAAADRRVGTYSGGMRRRLDLALALVHEPTVLFLDEPTTGLDPTSRISLWEEVRRLNTELGTTVFLTTQYLEEADELAHRVAIIDGGRIVREGVPSELKAAVGAPTLKIDVADDQIDVARRVLKAFAKRAVRAGRVAIGPDGEASHPLGAARRRRQRAVLHLELDSPSLDDVFADATGRRLEGAADDDAPAPEGAASAGRRR